MMTRETRNERGLKTDLAAPARKPVAKQNDISIVPGSSRA